MFVKCQICGKEFETTQERIADGRGKYCSTECQHKSMQKRVVVQCCICNKKFELKKSKAQKCKTHYCEDCMKVKRENHHKVCPVCGKQFYSSHKQTIYCSRKCKTDSARTPNEIKVKNNFAEIIINSKKWGLKKALIDIADVEECSKLTWQVKFCRDTQQYYVVSSKHDASEIKLHRYLTKCPNGLVVDHINHNPLDNRRENLRIITMRGNAVNQSKRKDNKSGCSGVFKTRSGKYKAVHYKTSLGVYNTKEEAIMMKNYYTEFVIKQEILKSEEKALN